MKALIALLEKVPLSVNALLCRWGIAAVFWRSGQTKVHGFFQINPTTFDLFREEYKIPVIPPDVAAVMATVSEHLFSVLLFIGLASRLSALALFGMTLVIEIFVYPESWPDHLMWASAMLFVLFRGPGKWSMDHLIGKKIRG